MKQLELDAPKGDRNDLLKYYKYVKVCSHCNTYYGDDFEGKSEYGTCPACDKNAPKILKRLIRGEGSDEQERD